MTYEPEQFRCEVCGGEACYGYGRFWPDKPGKWYCARHDPEQRLEKWCAGGADRPATKGRTA